MDRDDTSTALADIRAERVRQMHVEGWTPEHDDAHLAGEMARAAAAYAVQGSVPEGRDFQVDVGGHTFHGKHNTFRIGWFLPRTMLWPWDAKWWKPSDPRRNLVKAGALIVAEIERLDRAAARNVRQRPTMSRYDTAPTNPHHGGKMTDECLDAERRTAISAAEAIFDDVLGYMPDEAGDAGIIRDRIQRWLDLDAVRWCGNRR